jgi:23S rRNA pseudouridine1911/1915/1917 synthase
MMMENESIIIQSAEANERLDKILTSRFKGIKSRTYFQYLIEEGLVLLNGDVVKKRTIPKEGDEVEINFVLTPEIELKPEPIPLDILFEDQDLIAINKPAGLVVHPAVGNWSGTLVNGLLYHCKELPGGGESLRPGIVHRLDKDTSGVIIAAKHVDVQQKLTALFASRQMKKRYLAICVGNPGNQTFTGPIGRHPVHRQMMAIVEQGKPAITHCKVIKTDKQLTLVSIELETGRTHQIRIHLKHNGTPVLGDQLYGNRSLNEKFAVERQLLHAHSLEFTHPTTHKILKIEAPIPPDMRDIIKKYHLNA